MTICSILQVFHALLCPQGMGVRRNHVCTGKLCKRGNSTNSWFYFLLPTESSTQLILFEKVNEADKKMENKLSGIMKMNIIG